MVRVVSGRVEVVDEVVVELVVVLAVVIIEVVDVSEVVGGRFVVVVVVGLVVVEVVVVVVLVSVDEVVVVVVSVDETGVIRGAEPLDCVEFMAAEDEPDVGSGVVVELTTPAGEEPDADMGTDKKRKRKEKRNRKGQEVEREVRKTAQWGRWLRQAFFVCGTRPLAGPSSSIFTYASTGVLISQPRTPPSRHPLPPRWLGPGRTMITATRSRQASARKIELRVTHGMGI